MLFLQVSTYFKATFYRVKEIYFLKTNLGEEKDGNGAWDLFWFKIPN